MSITDELDELQALDRYRRRARELCKRAYSAIDQGVSQGEFPVHDIAEDLACASGAPHREAWDPIRDRTTVATVLTTEAQHVWLNGEDTQALEDRHENWAALAKALQKEDLHSLFSESESENHDGIPVLRAARVLRALSKLQTDAMSETAFACIHRILVELYSVSQNDFILGGARSSSGAKPTAFVTGECLRALFAFAATIEHTATLLEECSNLAQRHVLRASVAQLRSPQWMDCDLDAVIMSLRSRLTGRERASISRFTSAALGELGHCKSSMSIMEWSRKYILLPIRQSLRRAQTSINAVQVHATAQLENLRQSGPKDMRRSHPWPDQLGEITARRHALRLFAEFGNRIRDINARLTDAIKGHSAVELEAVAAELRVNIGSFKRLVHPAIVFVNSVLDHELGSLAMSDGRKGDVSEMVFAGVALVAIKGNKLDPRLTKAVAFALDRLRDGTLLSGAVPFMVNDQGFGLRRLDLQLVDQLLRLLDVTAVGFDSVVSRELLALIESSAIDDGVESLGWSVERSGSPRRSVWTTCIAAQALHRYVGVLDNELNRRVVRHFEHRTFHEDEAVRARSAGGKSALDVDGIMYSDYGLGWLRKAEPPTRKKVRSGHAMPIVLAGLRDHLLQKPLHQQAPPPYRGFEPGVVVFGPPGSGKTTMFEALGRTTRMSVVQVTASDIVVGGEAETERTMKAVFQALGYLTRTIIVFDEFDAVLNQRSAKPHTPLSIFELLTPGALTKLRSLADRAVENRFVYGLATNYLANLDDAVVRPGRFGARVGVYPPDVLSRATRGYAKILRELYDIKAKEMGSLDGKAEEKRRERGRSKTSLEDTVIKEIGVCFINDKRACGLFANMIRITAGLYAREYDALFACTDGPSPGMCYVCPGLVSKGSWAKASRRIADIENNRGIRLEELGRHITRLEQSLEGKDQAAWREQEIHELRGLLAMEGELTETNTVWDLLDNYCSKLYLDEWSAPPGANSDEVMPLPRNPRKGASPTLGARGRKVRSRKGKSASKARR